MAEAEDKRTPPYIPFKTFENFLNGLADTAVPRKIDNSLLRNMSGSARSGLMVALRYLDLIDADGNTHGMLEKVAHAKGDERKQLFLKIFGNAYGFVVRNSIDLKRATPGELTEAMGAEGATGGTRDKAVVFFIKACEASGFELSPHILARKHGGSGSKRKRATPKPAKPKEQHSNHNDGFTPAA